MSTFAVMKTACIESFGLTVVNVLCLGSDHKKPDDSVPLRYHTGFSFMSAHGYDMSKSTGFTAREDALIKSLENIGIRQGVSSDDMVDFVRRCWPFFQSRYVFAKSKRQLSTKLVSLATNRKFIEGLSGC